MKSAAKRPRETRTRILLGALALFNEQGEPNTTTNNIADEVDISPGNLHYHFSRKSDIVAALLAEFQADIRRVLLTPENDTSIDDFWIFLHLLLETTAVYRFLFRDIETLVARYPKVNHALRCLASGLSAVIELHLRGLARSGEITIESDRAAQICNNLVVILLFSGSYGKIAGATSAEPEMTALRVATAALTMLLPYASDDARPIIEGLLEKYRQ